MVPVHPLVVHFPVAFLCGAAALYLAGLFSQKKNLQDFAFLLHLGGLAGLVLAFFTGNAEEGNFPPSGEVHEMGETHERIGQVSMLIFGGLAIWVYLRKPFEKKAEQIIFALLFLFFTTGIGYNAHLGGRMVYEKGVGVMKGIDNQDNKGSEIKNEP